VASRQNSKFYLNNPKLPTAQTEFEYTDEMLRDIKKSANNMLYFAENFFYIIDPDEGRQKIKLFKYQRRCLRTLRDNRRVLLLASRQIGKALDINTPIPTPSGWTTMGKLEDGDQVYGLDGAPCNVVKAHDIMHNRECYEVEFDNGEKIVADADHNWFTQSKQDRRHKIHGKVRTTKELFETLLSYSEPNHRIPMCINGVQGVEQDLEIDPYILGLWLGDGCTDTSTITVGNRDIDHIINQLEKHTQYKLIVKKWKGQNAFSLRLGMLSGKRGMKNETCLSSELKALNLLGNKHIPEKYVKSTRGDRLKLLQGLMDSDGYINSSGYAQFYSINHTLALQVKQLIESLGYKTTINSHIPTYNGKQCAECYTVSFKPRELVCTIPFKASRIKTQAKESPASNKRNQWLYIKNISKVESRPVRCITVDSVNNLFLCGTQYIPTHNTTLLTIYALWEACFNDDKNIVIVANKEDTAKEIFRRVKLAYEELPSWIKPGIEEWGQTSCKFSNGTRIWISTTTGSSARGTTINTLILDELAFIEPASMLEAFWRSVYPTISRSKTSKVLIASTPNGVGNLFHKLVSEAESGIIDFAVERVMWDEMPREPGFKEREIATLGLDGFLQEYCCHFHDSGDSSIDLATYELLEKNCCDPPIILDNGAYKIWKEPNPDRIYAAGIDVGEGVGQDASIINIFDITNIRNIEQVAQWYSNTTIPVEFSNKCYEILQNWGCPFVLIERNNQGGQVVDRLGYDFGYENIVCYGSKQAKREKAQLGMISHTNTKYKAVTNMRYFLNEMTAVVLRDIHTLNELKTFVRLPNGVWKAETGKNDDRVMSTAWALMILEKEITEKYFEIVEFDSFGKPLKLEKMDFGVKYYMNPTSIYNNEQTNEMPTHLGAVMFGWGTQNDEMYDLEMQGWQQLANM
jgi:hypothetical protein